MAGDWIKMRMDLQDDPSVVKMSQTLRVSQDDIVGKLHRLWSWADRHTSDGKAPGIGAEWVDQYIGKQGFAIAMERAGWLSIKKTGIIFPHFDRHNGQSAKVRAEATLRKRRSRKQRDISVTKIATREEKRREEKNKRDPPLPPTGGTPVSVTWSPSSGWSGITDQHRVDWGAAYPACNLDRQLAAMTAWLRANPDRARKSNWPRFVTNWLRRQQDRGGDTPTVRPGKPTAMDRLAAMRAADAKTNGAHP